MTEGEFTLAEIFSQPEAWAAGLETARGTAGEFAALFQRESFEQVLFTGCGSTYYLAAAAAALTTQLTGRMARALPASELWFHPELAYPGKMRTMLIAVSRSGETSETLHACADFLKMGIGSLVTLSCYPGCALASLGTINLVLPSGMEQSVAQTRSFATLYLALHALIAAAVAADAAVATDAAAQRPNLLEALDKLPTAAGRLLQNAAPLAAALAEDESIDRFYFLGSGLRHGLACELSLKMKEMSLSHSEPFHFLEFRHGPKSMITPGTLIIALRSESDRAQENAVLEESAAQGARLLVIDEEAGFLPEGTEAAFASGVPEVLRGPLYLPVGQLLACRHALAKGLNPDRPANLESVVRL